MARGTASGISRSLPQRTQRWNAAPSFTLRRHLWPNRMRQSQRREFAKLTASAIATTATSVESPAAIERSEPAPTAAIPTPGDTGGHDERKATLISELALAATPAPHSGLTFDPNRLPLVLHDEARKAHNTRRVRLRMANF
jgi:hypothetical protein